MPESNPYEAPQSPLSGTDKSLLAPPGLTTSQRIVLILFCCQILAALLTWVSAYLGLPLLSFIFAVTFLLLLVGLLISSFNLPSLKLLAIETLFLVLTIKLALDIWEALGEL